MVLDCSVKPEDQRSYKAHLTLGPGKGERFCIFFQTCIEPQGMGIQPLGTSSGSILKLSLFPSFCTSSRKIPSASLFYDILFYFPGQGETTLEDNCFDGSRKVLSL